MASKGLTHCWRDAMAAKPSKWKLMEVACGPREVDPKIHSAEEWCALGSWAEPGTAGRPQERSRGRFAALTVELRKLKA